MAIVVDSRRSVDAGGIIKGLMDDFESLQEKKREKEDIKTLSAAGGDPEKLRVAMGSMRSKKGKTLALGQLGQVPTKLEEAHAKLYEEMPEIYRERMGAPEERAQTRLDQDVFSVNEMEKIAGGIKERFPQKAGWGRGKVMDSAAVTAEAQRLKDKIGYAQLGAAKRKQIDDAIIDRINVLNKGKGGFLWSNLANQYELPAAPPAQVPAEFPELLPRIQKLTPDQREKALDLLRRGVDKKKILEAIDRDIGAR